VRQVGDIIGRERATRFLNFLSAQRIAAELREEGGNAFRVWVVDEDHLERAEEMLGAFLSAPDDRRFDAPAAPVDRPQAAAPSARRPLVFEETSFGMGRVTLAFVMISVALTFVRDLPGAESFVLKLFFSQRYERSFPEIMDGELWRIITPIFLHGGWLHLIFNMLWLFQLGGAIERLEGSGYLAAMVLLTGALCNTAQYLVAGPNFMGMSGVVYGLLGYIWMMSKYKAGTQYGLPQQTVGFMLIWLVICLIGLIPNVANTQHVVGLLLGVTWGFVRSGRLRELRRQAKFKRSQR
jgi:GlpG protein